MAGTVEAITRELDDSGVLLRYLTHPPADTDGLPSGQAGYLPGSFWLARVLAAAGRTEEARRLFTALLALRNDVGLLAEGYDPLRRRFTGNYPLAGSAHRPDHDRAGSYPDRPVRPVWVMCREPATRHLDPGHPEPARASSGSAAAEAHNGRGGLTYMSRPFFMPLLAPEAPGRRLGRPAGKSRSRAAGWLRSRAATRQAPRARAPIPYLGVTTSLEGCRGNGLADAVLHRVLGSGAPVGTVVLDLGAAATLDPETCAAILLVHQRLTAIGTRLRLAASARGLIDCLAGAGVVQQLGRDTIHTSFRGAVLAVYAAQPGPGLAVGRIRTELEMQAETIELLSLDGPVP